MGRMYQPKIYTKQYKVIEEKSTVALENKLNAAAKEGYTISKFSTSKDENSSYTAYTVILEKYVR